MKQTLVDVNTLWAWHDAVAHLQWELEKKDDDSVGLMEELRLDIERSIPLEADLDPHHVSIATWSHTDPIGWIEYVRGVWDHDYGKIESDGALTTLITGGWSGNESLVSAMSRNLPLWLTTWQSSFRGGKHVFCVRGCPVS